jgi:uncharacterized membrane protein
MSETSIRQVPNSYGIKWMACAWHFARAHYKTTLIASFYASLLLYGLSFVPLLGKILSALVTPLITVGMLRFTERLHRGEKPKTEEIFFAFKDNSVAKAFAPLMGLNVLLALPDYAIPNISPGIGILVFLITLVIESFLILAIPLIYYRKVQTIEAVKISFNAILINAVPYTIYGLVGICVVFFSGILLAVPLIFAVMPASILIQYLQYQSIFEGLDIEALEKQLETPALL